MFSYALSEPEAGSDAAAMRTRAVRDGDDYVLNGAKRWITNAGHLQVLHGDGGDRPGRRARTASPRSWWRTDDEGFTFGAPEKKLGIKGSPTRELYFDDCRIPADRLVGAEGTGFKTALRTLDHTRVTIAAQAVGIAQGALDYAVGYAKERKQFGQAIAEFQGMQFMLADMAMKLEAARQLTYVAAAKSERRADRSRGPDVLRPRPPSASLRRRDGGHDRRRAAARRLRLRQDYPVERMMRDAKITQIYEGTNQIQRLVMARQLLKG